MLRRRIQKGLAILAALVRWYKPSQLQAHDYEEIWAFSSQFFERSKADYLEMLSSSDDICLLRVTGELIGIGATRYIELELGGRKRRIIYVVTVQIAPDFRGSRLTSIMGLSRLIRARLSAPTARLYQLFSAGTPASYLMLSKTFAEHWPRPDIQMPSEIAELMREGARVLGHPDWDVEDRVLKRNGAVRWRDGAPKTDVESKRLIAYYYEMNPRQDQGDTLLCIWPWSWPNVKDLLLALGRKMRKGGIK